MGGLSCGIVGLPNVGKSTLFNALLKKKRAEASNFPFCTIDPNTGIVEVPDPRLELLASLSKSRSTIPTTVTFVDIAGLVKGASRGKGLGNHFLSHVRQTDALVHVLRCFEEEAVIHVEGAIDPIADIETIDLELILADLEMLKNILQKLERQAKGNSKLLETIDPLKKIEAELEQNHPIRSLPLTREELAQIKPHHFLTAKKVIYVANISERDIQNPNRNPHYKKVAERAQTEGSSIIPICAELEEALTELPKEEARTYLETAGLREEGLDLLIRNAYTTLNLITFFTTGERETRAWPLKRGSTLKEAAGKIHTDIQRGLIRAEVISSADFVRCRGKEGVREEGKVRIESKEYPVRDGEILLFFHN